jgi:WD40 repeat protein
MAALFEELSRDADTWRGSELTPTENGVFFVRNHATGSDFYMSALNGNMPSRFTNLSFQATTGASMNPTSSVMAFTANVGGIWRLYKLSSGGTPPSVLLTLPVLPTSAPTINPVGNTVAVGTAGGAIYVYDLTTGSQVKLLATGSSADVMRVAFSPNGAKIGFITAAPSADPGTGEVGSVTVASNVVQRSSGYGRAIAWDPNSSKLAYGEREIYVWTVGSGTRTLVLNTGGQLQSLLWR